MFNLGFSEMVIIAVIALIFIGPKQLPEVAVKVGRLLNELKQATSDLTSSFVKARNSADQYLRETRDQVGKAIDPHLADQVKSGFISVDELPPHDPMPDEAAEPGTDGHPQLSLGIDLDSHEGHHEEDPYNDGDHLAQGHGEVARADGDAGDAGDNMEANKNGSRSQS